MWTNTLAVVYGLSLRKFYVRWQETGPHRAAEGSTNLVYAHGASAPSIYGFELRSTVSWLAGPAVVQGCGLWAQDEEVAPDAVVDNSTFGCDFEFKPEEVTTMPIRTALSVGHLPTLLEKNLKA